MLSFTINYDLVMDGMISITNFSTPPNRRVVAARGSGSNGFNIVSPYHSAGIRASFVPGNNLVSLLCFNS